MDKGKAAATPVTTSPEKLNSNPLPRFCFSKREPPTLLGLCVGVLGAHLEDILEDLGDIAVNLPPDVKMAMAAIARRRKLLNDDLIVALAECSWDILDVSNSDVSDFGLANVAAKCKFLRAVDISQCSKVTVAGVAELLQHCGSLEILRCGGNTARGCLDILKPKLHDVEGESWEELDATEMVHGAQSLRWLIWPEIDDDSLTTWARECPRIIINPKPSPLGFRGMEVPREALSNIPLDDHFVKGIDPVTWAVKGCKPRAVSPSPWRTEELPIAEKFRLAFLERDTRLAPKRAKNVRQHQRRAEKEWMLTSSRAKAISLASQAAKSLRSRNL